MLYINLQMGIFYTKQSPLINQKPFKSQEIQLIAAQFCYDRTVVHKLYSCFSSFLSSPKAYLTLDDIAENLHHGHPNFSQMPFLQRLFSLISKKTPGKLFFEDYLTGISTFCLMNTEAILHFVFDWLDNDDDERILIQDIILAADYIHPMTNEQIFFSNFAPDIQKFRKAKENSRFIEFEEFRQQSNKILFLIWPAYQLQQKLREINLGSDFWRKQYIKIEKAEMTLKNTEKKAYRMLDKVRQLKSIKINININQPTIKQQFLERIGKRASTDFQLLQTKPQKRRKSCPYIKWQITSIQINQQLCE